MFCPFISGEFNHCREAGCMMFWKLSESGAKFTSKRLGGKSVTGMCSLAYNEDKPTFIMNTFTFEEDDGGFDIPTAEFSQVEVM